MAKTVGGITVVSPMWGERSITDRMVFSVITQYIPEDTPFKINLVLVDDYLEGRGEDDSSPYDYYLSDEFKSCYDTEKIEITLIKNKEHKYQGESREIGFLRGTYDFFLLLDCDDMLAPNCCERFMNIIRLEASKEEPIPIGCIQGLLYSFGPHGYEHNIPGHSIWVQSRCYNRRFIKKHGIHFPTGLGSRQGEDYPFIRKLDYALEHDKGYQICRLDYEQGHDCQCTSYWFPNESSLSRKDPHYGQHLSGWTMQSSNSILDFFDEFNKKNGFIDEEDEFMKHEYLNMNIYAFYNLLDFLKEVASTDYKPLEEDWYALRDNVAKLRTRLKNKYYPEIVYSDIEDMLYQVKHFSDCRFTESWLGTFYDYMNADEFFPLNFSYDEMMDYCCDLEFDGVGHEVHSPQVMAWAERHKDKQSEEE